MIIRRAIFPDDADAVLPLAWRFALEAGVHDLLDEAWADDVLAVLTAPGVEVWLAIEDEAVVGGVGLVTHPFIWNPRALVRTELFMWTKPEAGVTAFLRLLRTTLGLPTAAEIDEWSMLPSSPAGLAAVYAKTGFAPVQTSYWRKR